MPFSLPDLPYSYNALEPHIDTRTMEIHHKRHHNLYISILNNAIAGTDQDNLSIEENGNLTKLILFEFNNNNINKNSDVIYDSNKDTLESIKLLVYDKKTNKYSFIKKISKSSTKSKSNIERILKF